jgi:hypothetical protein
MRVRATRGTSDQNHAERHGQSEECSTARPFFRRWPEAKKHDGHYGGR